MRIWWDNSWAVSKFKGKFISVSQGKYEMSGKDLHKSRQLVLLKHSCLWRDALSCYLLRPNRKSCGIFTWSDRRSDKHYLQTPIITECVKFILNLLDYSRWSMVENTCVLERRCQTTLKTPFRGVSHCTFCITHVHNSCLSARAVYPFNYTPGGISCRGNRVAIYLLISISSGPPNKLFIVSNIPCREFFSYEKYLVHVQRILHSNLNW